TLYSLGAVGTCVRLQSPVTSTNGTTYYFRTHFTYANPPGSSLLLLHGKIDDAAVIYLNGTEVQRVRLPAAPAVIGRGLYATNIWPLASQATTVNDGDAQDTILLAAPGSL